MPFCLVVPKSTGLWKSKNERMKVVLLGTKAVLLGTWPVLLGTKAVLLGTKV